ncbi:MAG: type II and III secretion system protein family protein [Beijerinckiaceae bacterium]|nr:type II and III secretion system protein family protein [Beijerinckiaceae bacterium]MDO9439987.1 type II and III secretion system protein family protein [Beijerinckiaceae bacterium]
MSEPARTPVAGRALALAAGLLSLGCLAVPAQAQSQRGQIQRGAEPAAAVAPDSGLARRLSMGVGKSVIIDLPRDAAEIFVGNPKVANAVVRSPRKLYIIGMEGGQTTIFAMDAAGRQIATIEISIGRDIQELDRILKTAMPNSSIALRTVNDTIILTGTVDSAGEAQQALDIAYGFVGQGGASNGGAAGAAGNPAAAGASGRVINSLVIRGKDQVMLKVTIAEVQRQVMKQLGVTSATVGGGWGKLTMTNPLSLNLQQPSDTNLTIPGTSASATLQAFERYGVARVLAEPTVTAVSGEGAKFTAGGELPVPGSQSCATDPATGRAACTVGISFKPYGISLNFTPVVLSEGRILLRVATEVTEVDNTQSFTFSTVNVPAFRTRKNETTVELPSGASIVSAGLIQVRSRQVINGLPGLMNLPVLGTLFRSRDYQREESELMIIVTPYIAKPVSPSEVMKPTDNFVDATDPQSWLLGRVNRLYSTKSNPEVISNFNGRVGFIND